MVFRYIICAIIFLVTTVAVCSFFPTQTTLVNPALEDMASYLAALEIQSKKLALQDTLPAHEEVLDIYEEPKYVTVSDTCDWQFAGECVPIMTGPGDSYPKAYIHYKHQGPFLQRVRIGQVFPVSALIKAKDESLWYKIVFDKSKMLFPSRLHEDWYVPASRFAPVDFTPINPQNDHIKNIVISLSEQQLYAYEGETLFMKTKVSTGQSRLGLTTDIGKFYIYKKIPMTIMEGPLPSMVSMMNENNILDFEYTLFVPFAMAFNPNYMGISFIHQAYWHNGFGTERSHGCVNITYQDATKLYNWTPDPSVTKIPVTVLP